MESNFNWTTLELQIESLIPGIIIAGEIAIIWGHCFDYASLIGSGFAFGLFFVAASYGLGVIAGAVSRFIVDSISEWGPRKWIFHCKAHEDLKKISAYLYGRDVRFRDHVTKEGEMMLDWNEVYRSAVRITTRREEVDRRRSQGRVLRGLFIPVIIAPFMITKLTLDISNCCWIVVAIVALGLGILMIFFYSYHEYSVFAEAYDISQQHTVDERCTNSDSTEI